MSRPSRKRVQPQPSRDDLEWTQFTMDKRAEWTAKTGNTFHNGMKNYGVYNRWVKQFYTKWNKERNVREAKEHAEWIEWKELQEDEEEERERERERERELQVQEQYNYDDNGADDYWVDLPDIPPHDPPKPVKGATYAKTSKAAHSRWAALLRASTLVYISLKIATANFSLPSKYHNERCQLPGCRIKKIVKINVFDILRGKHTVFFLLSTYPFILKAPRVYSRRSFL
jgi:hypothetical protein